MNEPPGARLRVALSRPRHHRVLPRRAATRTCCSSSTTSSASRRRARKCRRCSAARRARSATSRRSRAEMGVLQERITSTKKGSITSFQAVYVPADDLTDPAPATTFAHLDATIVLERAIAELGHLPGRRSAGVDVARARARDRRRGALRRRARACRRCSSGSRTCRTSSRSSAWTSCRPTTSSRCIRARKIQRFLSQPFSAAQVFTGREGRQVPVADTVRGFKEILDGKHDAVPEENFYMKGGIDEHVRQPEDRDRHTRGRGFFRKTPCRSPATRTGRSASAAPRPPDDADGAWRITVRSSSGDRYLAVGEGLVESPPITSPSYPWRSPSTRSMRRRRRAARERAASAPPRQDLRRRSRVGQRLTRTVPGAAARETPGIAHKPRARASARAPSDVRGGRVAVTGAAGSIRAARFQLLHAEPACWDACPADRPHCPGR